MSYGSYRGRRQPRRPIPAFDRIVRFRLGLLSIPRHQPVLDDESNLLLQRLQSRAQGRQTSSWSIFVIWVLNKFLAPNQQSSQIFRRIFRQACTSFGRRFVFMESGTSFSKVSERAPARHLMTSKNTPGWTHDRKKYMMIQIGEYKNRLYMNIVSKSVYFRRN